MEHDKVRLAREERIKALSSAAAGRIPAVPAEIADLLRQARGPNMADLFVVVTVLAFFGLCVALVWGCDKIIGPDDPDTLDDVVAAPCPAEAVSR